MAKAVRINQVA